MEVTAYILHSSNPENRTISDVWNAIAIALGYSPEAKGWNQLQYVLRTQATFVATQLYVKVPRRLHAVCAVQVLS